MITGYFRRRSQARRDRILTALRSDPARAWYGVDLWTHTRMRSGVMYVELARLERAGVVTSRWEDPSRNWSRPRRRLYQIHPDWQGAADTAGTTGVEP